MQNIQDNTLLSNLFDNKDTWDNRKLVSEILSDTQTSYFKNKVIPFTSSPDKKLKLKADIILKCATRQSTCSEIVDFVHSKKGDDITSRLLNSERCTSRKTCPICASIDGKKRLRILLQFFKDVNKHKEVICYPFTISPKNFSSIKEGYEHLSKFLDKWNKALDKGKEKRGNKKSKLAISQLKKSIATYWTMEVEPSKSQEGMYNMHWHGLIFMELDKDFSNTLDYSSFKEFVNWSNNDVSCSNHIGNTRNKMRPITIKQKNHEKVFCEVTKYITKMSTKTNKVNKKEIRQKQELIFEVYAETYNKRFIRTTGQLIKYKLQDELDFTKPDKIYNQELSNFTDKYDQKVSQLGQDEVKLAWFDLQRLGIQETKLENAERKREMIDFKLISCSNDAKKNLDIRIKGIETMIKNTNEKIHSTIIVSQQRAEKVGELFIKYQDKKARNDTKQKNRQENPADDKLETG